MTEPRTPPMTPPAYISPARRIDALTDPNFMTSLARGLAVIHAFQERKRQLTIAQISHRTEIPRASVRRCLQTLMKLGYVSNEGRTYSLRPKVLSLGYAYLSSTPLAISAQPFLDGISEQLNEAASLGTLDELDVLYLARSATPQRLISVDLSVGSRLPAYCTSMGRILLAALDETSLQDYLDQAELQPRTSRTLHTSETLRACLRDVREQGWCIVDQELEQGLRSIAVPVYGAGGEVLAAMNVSGHAARVTADELKEKFLPVLLHTSQELTRQLFAIA